METSATKKFVVDGFPRSVDNYEVYDGQFSRSWESDKLCLLRDGSASLATRSTSSFAYFTSALSKSSKNGQPRIPSVRVSRTNRPPERARNARETLAM